MGAERTSPATAQEVGIATEIQIATLIAAGAKDRSEENTKKSEHAKSRNSLLQAGVALTR